LYYFEIAIIEVDVKIYFFDEEKAMLRKAFSEFGSEYTNQDLTPDYS